MRNNPPVKPEVPIDAKTLRFRFDDMSFDPSTYNGGYWGSSGTWTKRAEFEDNVWDWTNNSNNWFNGLSNGPNEYTATYSIIAAGDTPPLLRI